MTQPSRQDGPPTLQRVPPHDLVLERHLLGAALITADAAAIVGDLPGDTWYQPSHATIAHTIGTLHREGSPTDSGTVAAVLRAEGQLDAVGGPPALIQLMTEVPALDSAATYATLLQRLRRQRITLALAAEIVEGVYRGVELTGLSAELHAAAAETSTSGTSTWDVANLALILAGEQPDIVPTICARDDNACLLYPGKVNAVNAEPEAGKTWLLILACTQELKAGHHVLYIDFEADAADIVNRLLALGATPTQILEQFHYVRPGEPIDAAARVRITQALNAWPITLAVIDGVTEAMATTGWSIKENDDIARFYAALPRHIANQGPAVALIDHVVKDREQRGRYAIGGQHKLAGIDGASYALEVVRPFGRNQDGHSRLIVTKDRHGWVRKVAANARHAGDLHMRSTDTHIGLTLNAPPAGGADGEFVPTGLMEAISRQLEAATGPLTKRTIRTIVKGRNQWKDKALEHLILAGHATETKGGYTSVTPYRQTPDIPAGSDHQDPLDEPF